MDALYPARLGQGFDSFADSARPQTPVQVVSAPSGASSELRIKFCEDVETIYDHLEVTTSASASLGRVAEVEAKAKFVRDLRVTTTTLTVLINVRVTASNESVVEAHLKPGIVLPTDKASAQEFFKRNGDSYVSRLAKGAEYIAAYAFYAESTDQREKVKASLKAKGIVDGVTLTAAVGTGMKHVVETSKTRYTINQTVLGRGAFELPKPEKMIDFALKFPKETSPSNPNAVVLAYQVSGYEALGVRNFTEIEENRRRLQGDHEDVGVARKRSRLYEVKNQARWLKDVVYATYGSKTDDAFKVKFDLIEADLKGQAAWLDKVAADPTVLHTLPTDKSFDLGVPVFTYKWVDAPSWGGPGGNPFKDIVQTDAVPKKSLPIAQIPWLSIISARGGDMLDKLHLTYTYNADVTGSESRTETFDHGGGGGRTDGEVLQLNFGQPITSITVHVGTEYKYVQQISLVTKGKKPGRPGEPEKPGQTWTFPAKIGDGGWGPTTSISWTVPEGQVVVGFAGSSGDYLDRLEPLVIEITQPEWD